VAASWESIRESGIIQAFWLIFLSEIGDKTFFVAAILASKSSKRIAYAGAMCAMSLMVIVAIAVGQAAQQLDGIANGVPWDSYLAVTAFMLFGIKMLKDAVEMPESGAAKDEAQAEVANSCGLGAGFRNAFILVLAAAFGDRSFLSTMTLAASGNPVCVGVGSVAAQSLTTAFAVTGGSWVAARVSEKSIGYFAGTLFILFALMIARDLF
jgi:putative Ca2+/H+ antiporter (TMEM165/GDT1 family)